MKLQDKVIVITGASQGLGKALALKAGSEGSKVALVARSEDLLQKIKENIRAAGGEAEYFVCDIRKVSQIKESVAKIVQRFGTVDILINNAGIWTTNEIEEKQPEKIQEAFEVNTLGPIHFTNEVLPILKEKNSGYIFNVISTSAASDIPEGDSKDWLVYGASKWAMRGFTKDLRNALRETKIKVTAFFPGGMDTNIFEKAGEEDAHDQPWMMKVEDVADVIIFALTRPEDVLMESILLTKVS